MLTKAKRLALDYINSIRPIVIEPYSLEDMYVVWFCKTLQNWKALVSTDVVSGVYVEVTHNGDKHETYVDIYTQSQHWVVKDDP